MRGKLKGIIVYILLLGLSLTACNSGSANASQTTYQISPTFRELYEKLGGNDVLGAAISKPFTLDSFECQYTVNVLICVNPQATDSNRLFFYPLANSMNIREDPSQSPAQPGSNVVDGYTIYDEFISLYNQLGAQFTGKPLTQAHINYSQQRIEQYFENVGFYRKFSDTAGSVHLLAYGAYSCLNKCNYTPSVEASILNSARASLDQPLLAGLSEIADTSILGEPLTQPYIASDGMEEQVYTNAVVYAPVNDLNSARLRPVSTLINIPRTEPGTQKYSSRDGMVFYAIKGNKGYHVPLVFDQFIANHGGKNFSGNPIDEVFQYSATVFRQCFENYCLDYDSAASDSNKISLAPLGMQYIQQISGSSSPTVQPANLSSDNLILNVAKMSQKIPADGQQQIQILVIQKENQQPVPNLEATLTIKMPDGSLYTAQFPATGVDGRSALVIPPMKDIPNGTILELSVCINGTDNTPVCVTDGYLIWPSQ
jgi:hypothetical protein